MRFASQMPVSTILPGILYGTLTGEKLWSNFLVYRSQKNFEIKILILHMFLFVA